MQPNDALRRAKTGAKRAVWMVAIFSLFANMLMLTVPIFMLQMYDRVIPSRNTDTLLFLGLMAAVALGVMAALEGVRGRIMVRLGTWVDRELSGPLLAGGMNDALRTGGSRGAQGLRDLASIRSFLTGSGIFPLFDFPWVFIFIPIIFLMHPMLGWIALIGAILVFAFAIANDVMNRADLKKAGAESMRSLYRADSVVRNADVIAAMGMMPDIVRRWSQGNDVGLGYTTKAGERAGLISAAAKYVRLLLQILMLGTGAWLVTEHVITGGAMIAASIILGRALAPVEQSISAYRGFVSAWSSWGNITQLLERTPNVGEGMTLPKPEGRLDVEGVTFVPAGGREPIIRQVTFSLEPGEVLGLIGASAAGKTTLARLLVGSWTPNVGNVRLDSADVSAWEAIDRGRHVGYLPQDVELFDGTVRENIARLQNADDAEIVEAAKLAGVHETILRLPDGYDTQIGEGGAKLSGGQRQRIALARAVFGDPRLVVLDEPNASLDSEGETALLEAIDRLKDRGTTLVVIAHRPSILAHVDKLMVMRFGRVEMFGPREEILAKVTPAPRIAAAQAEARLRQGLASGRSPNSNVDVEAEADEDADDASAAHIADRDPRDPAREGADSRPGAAGEQTGTAAPRPSFVVSAGSHTNVRSS